MHPYSLGTIRRTNRATQRAALAALLGTLATSASAQALPIPFNDPAVKRAMDAMQPLQAWTLDQQASGTSNG